MKETTRERLIIFTRYPEPGTTKTRMIPALGAEGAAKLQRQMTEHTLMQGRKLQGDRSLSVEVHFAGGNQQLMRDWLGSDLVYRKQDEGDLGQRMKSAFEASFAAGMTGVVTIGIDCPDVNGTLMTEAFEALHQHDLVLGPAADGGYYLIGLGRLIPELFTGISWGTSEVLAKTKGIAQKLQLTVHYLSLLNDVDRPEDLHIWQRYQIEG
ncbi:MAG: TIGR04282 family arsenosugar biosynthesis glycosyltransferase [Xenococcaceae cyanobacterium]